MSTRWLVLVIAGAILAVLVVALVLSAGDDGEPVVVPTPSASPSPSVSPSVSSSPSSTSSASPTPGASPSTTSATAFSATGDLVSGWYWLRDTAHQSAATWQFTALPATGDLKFVVEVLATDAADGERGLSARFYFAWRPTAGDWSGRLPVTLPNVSPPADPVGYTCRGTVTVPRSMVGDTPVMTVRISRDDVRGELSPIDMHLAVNATSVTRVLP